VSQSAAANVQSAREEAWTVTQVDDRNYLAPYLDAATRHGAGFRSLLWASQASQAARFDAICRLVPMKGKIVLDAGSGRGDLLDFLAGREQMPQHYFGLEAVESLARAAELKHHPNCSIMRGDFVREAQHMNVGADVIVFCGSLNTLERDDFYATLSSAMEMAPMVVFNFLSSPRLAAAKYLTWHAPSDVIRFVKQMGMHRMLDDYIDGDCTISVHLLNRE
jgi:hypothetical protein